LSVFAFLVFPPKYPEFMDTPI